jgi:GT2 family glycosyltransferase
MEAPSPLVRVVVVNYDGGQMTIDCLRSLLASEWPADRLDVVLVDNASIDNVVDQVRASMPAVRIIEPMANTGFAGGCNLGIRAPGDFDLLALVNNDATVSPDWLRPLADWLLDDARIGAACPKILFDRRYVEAEIDVPDARQVGSDPRTLGVRLTAVRVAGDRDDSGLAFDEGFFGPEPPARSRGEELARWTWRRARVRVRAENGVSPPSIGLRLYAAEPRHVTVRSTVEAASRSLDAHESTWITIRPDPEPFDVINNAGSDLYPHGFGGDRGFLHRDGGQFDEPAEVFAWCGGGVLMSRAYLDDVGLLDEDFFLYYEDTDLSWRGRLRGWRYVYEPRAVIRHRHAASSGVGSPVFRYHTERNRLLMLIKNAPAGLAWRETLAATRRLILAAGRDLVLRPVRLRMPVRAEVAHQGRVLAGVVRRAPAMLRRRWSAGTTVDRAALLSWTRTKESAR